MTIRLKLTPQPALKLKFIPAVPGLNAAASEAAAEGFATLANTNATAAAASAALAAAAVTSVTILANQQSSTLAFAGQAATSARIAKKIAATITSQGDDQLVLKAAFFN